MSKEARLTFWSSWGQTLNSLTEITKRIFLPVFLFLLIGLFWFFGPLGPGALNTLFALALFSGSLYWYARRREESLEFLVFLTVFLGFAALYNLQYAFFVPLWLWQLLIFIFSFLMSVYLCFEKKIVQNSLLLSFGLSICLLEIYYVISFWPTNPLSKSFILTSLFYAFWFIVVKKEEILKYLILVAAVLILVLSTTRWPVI